MILVRFRTQELILRKMTSSGSFFAKKSIFLFLPFFVFNILIIKKLICKYNYFSKKTSKKNYFFTKIIIH